MKNFTFQYVSIKTCDRAEEGRRGYALHSNMYLLKRLWTGIRITILVYFTFQYVSIKTFRPASFASFPISLHSNMYLLKRPDARKNEE